MTPKFDPVLFAKAISDDTRQKIMSECCCCTLSVTEIVEKIGLSQPTISHHLRILKEAGLVTADKRGKWVYYSLIKGRAEDLKVMVDQLLGASQLALL